MKIGHLFCLLKLEQMIRCDGGHLDVLFGIHLVP